ncbi:glycoside hydrolase family 6 protein [Streptomyces sp. NPDC046316]|uniref:glycoside hydrolase family 6 protein n=1 Tax=Streptomyces sp. NPDC046316 TaxID=3154494 RepID=UPI0033D3B93A
MKHTPISITVLGTCALVASLLAVPASAAEPEPEQALYGELARNGTFATNTDDWWGTPGVSMTVEDGALRATVEPAPADQVGQSYRTVMGQNRITLRPGVTYTLSFDASASRATKIRSTVQLGTEPYPASLANELDLTTAAQHFSWTFTSSLDSADGHIDFQVGGQDVRTDIVLDNVSLTTSTAREGFYTDPASTAMTWVRGTTDPRAAKIASAVADHTTVKWFGNWDADGDPATGPRDEVGAYVGAAAARGELPVLVAYNIPGRDCGGASSGGSEDADRYKAWIDAFAQGIGGRPAVVILEPDAVAQSADPGCISGEALEARFDMLWYANQHLQAQGGLVRTYLDGGNATWTLGQDLSGDGGIGLKRMAYLLNRSGVSMARGVSIGVSNFDSTDISNQYGSRLAAQLKADFGVDARWVVDTARNGNGAYVTPGDPESGHVGFCNPPGRKLGVTSRAGEGGAEYLLWIKNPGDSDGDSAACPPGSPPAGSFSPDLADALVEGR